MRVWSPVTLALGFGRLLVFATEDIMGNGTDACCALAEEFPGDVAFPNSTAFAQSSVYWSNQQVEVSPSCFVTPRDTKTVSGVVKFLTRRNIPFNVKGGGHAPHAGDSNLANGVTIDLAHLKDIDISEDRQTVSIGPGLRWVNVSEVLDPISLAVVGGRAADVGVAGLILGGGISYFSAQKGWACDNVRNFEIVLASGEIVDASPEENKDLYWALRGGGGSNYGIVTRFDLASFEQGEVWSDVLTLPGSANHTMIRHFQDFTINGQPNDAAAHAFVAIAHDSSLGGYVVNANFYHATVPPAGTIPEVFTPFQSVPEPIVNDTIVSGTTTHFRNMDIPYGFRQTWYNTVISAKSIDFIHEIVSLYKARNVPILEAAGDTSIIPFLTFQAISTDVLELMQKNGGNPLNLCPEEGPLLLVSLPTTWSDPSLDELIETKTQKLINKIISMAKERNLGRGFVYMNYGGDSQGVLESYGEKNLRKLRQVAKKYDFLGKLAKLWPGYFKLE